MGNLIAVIIEAILFVDSIKKQRIAFTYFFGAHICMTMGLAVIVLLYWSEK